MTTRDNFPALHERILTLFINLAVFFTAFVAATGNLLPTGGIESVWLLSALALWFFTLLSAPWFIPPRDALVNSIAAIAILVTVDLSPINRFPAELNILRWVSVSYCVVITILSLRAGLT